MLIFLLSVTTFIVYCTLYHPSSPNQTRLHCVMMFSHFMSGHQLQMYLKHLGGSSWCCFVTQKPILLPPQQHEAPPPWAASSRHRDEIQNQSSWCHPQKKTPKKSTLDSQFESIPARSFMVLYRYAVAQHRLRLEQLLVTSGQTPIT